MTIGPVAAFLGAIVTSSFILYALFHAYLENTHLAHVFLMIQTSVILWLLADRLLVGKSMHDAEKVLSDLNQTQMELLKLQLANYNLEKELKALKDRISRKESIGGHSCKF